MMKKGPVVLIGAEFEENLSLRYLAAAVVANGFTAEIVAFNHDGDRSTVVERVRRQAPLLVGISVPFQVHAPELLGLAGEIKAVGVGAPVIVGGHFATFEYASILRDFPAVDAVVRHEGEVTLAEICCAVASANGTGDGISAIAGLPGTVVRDLQAGLEDGGKRALPKLDDLPWPDRRGPAHQVMGVPCSPIIGSRGCYADCSFCCIFAYADNADGARYRMRSPENIVAEMRAEYRERGVRLFIFHDDNFFVPSERKNLARYGRMKELLDEAGMDDIALVIKCRPNDVTRDVFMLLKSMGMIRAYVGIETNSDEGIVSLNRRITSEDNRRALELLKELDVYRTFNVLIFDPEATLDGIRRNLDFMEDHADTPFNFCRAEVYAGTPLKTALKRDGRLEGDYMAWGYEMRDPRVELLFRIASTAFASRNFKPDGVHNLNLGVRFDSEVMRRFHPGCWDPEWHRDLQEMSRSIGLNSVALMREALHFAAVADLGARAAVKRFAVDLSRRVARADLRFVQEIKGKRREMERRIRDATGRGIAAPASASSLPVWAAETGRLASSVGSGFATELLPEPSSQPYNRAGA